MGVAWRTDTDDVICLVDVERMTMIRVEVVVTRIS